MDLVIKPVVDGITYLHECYLWTYTIRDRRVDGWPFMSSVKPTIVCLTLYYLMVFFGPKIMKNRKPFSLKSIMLVYNMFITLLNAYILIELAIGSYRLHYSWFCQPIHISEDVESMRIVKALYLYFISKLLEFSDTFFFILRKKNNQLSFLHIYHHSTMFFFWWLGCRWVPGGSAFLGPMINAFIHVLMYSYYGLSALGPNVRKFLWWKQYLTILQLIQFMGGVLLGMNGILTGCTFTRWMQYLLVIYMMSFLVLFGNFYRNAYIHGLRAAYRMEMKDRTGVNVVNGKANGHSNNHQNGHIVNSNSSSSSSSTTETTLRSRSKTTSTTASILAANILTEEVAPHLAKHASS